MTGGCLPIGFPLSCAGNGTTTMPTSLCFFLFSVFFFISPLPDRLFHLVHLQVESDAFSLGSSDIATFVYREKVAHALFLAKFGDKAGAATMQASADALHRAIDTHLWDPVERWVLASIAQAGRLR